MPITFIDVERQKSWRIALLFVALLVIYLAGAMVIVYGCIVAFSFHLVLYLGPALWNLKLMAAVFSVAAGTASIHFCLSAYNAVPRIKKALGAIPPDPDDLLHRRLINILEEIHVASGHRVRMECVVLPTLSMNALSAVDIKGNALIAITEGLVSRFSREQLEAVMAHEAYHILSGDCLESTVATSLFGLPSALVEKGGDEAVFNLNYLAIPIFLSFILLQICRFLNFFISRQREYRADAGAVRMTRNPLALAEVLYLLSRKWRGDGYIGRGLEALCIEKPRTSDLDEQEGWLADLLSTHPPVRKRIQILLDMARVPLAQIAAQQAEVERSSAQAPPEPRYEALDTRYAWQGPFALAELLALPWFGPHTWVRTGAGLMERANEVPILHQAIRERLVQRSEPLSNYACPRCRHPLLEKLYEKTKIHECSLCGGALLEESKLSRVIARTSGMAPERIRALARAMLAENRRLPLSRKPMAHDARSAQNPSSLLDCPSCQFPMLRGFYSYAYLVEIDRCIRCNLVWFDKDELLILQAMISEEMAGKISDEASDQDLAKLRAKLEAVPPVT